MVSPVMELGAPHDLGRRVGMLMSIYAFGALAGPPISGAINTATGGFKAVGYYAVEPKEGLPPARKWLGPLNVLMLSTFPKKPQLE
ncbi:hypothetical protein H0H93_009640 [Arthromyces matolae]|nr:hypothetical protein H0H93_009640 [Arthromyces matolae]